jgi:ABC-2 type transport system permease protein
MLTDILTVAWKERRTQLRQPGGRWRTFLNLLLPFALIGLYGPISNADWVNSPFVAIMCTIFSMVFLVTTIPDSFAGERERHTLPTLLASRLPDPAILLGKLVVAIAYGWGVTMLALLFGLIVANVVHWDAAPLMYAPRILVPAMVMSLFSAVTIALAGVLVSLRAATVQGAAQTLVTALMLPGVALQILGVVVFSRPEWRQGVRQGLDSVRFESVALTLILVMLILDVLLMAAVLARFQRSKLIAQ